MDGLEIIENKEAAAFFVKNVKPGLEVSWISRKSARR
jgi:hypothetical protein